MAVIGVIGGLLGKDFSIPVPLVPFIFLLTVSFSWHFPPGALFNQLTLYLTSWRRNSLHKKGNRVKVITDGHFTRSSSFIWLCLSS